MNTQLHNKNTPFAGATLRKDTVDKPLASGSLIMENQQEIWKDVIGYEGIYKVSNFGKIKSLSRKKQNRHFFITTKEMLLSPCNRGGYLRVVLQKNLSKRFVSVHRVVAEAFIPNPYNKETVNHIDANKVNNSVENLEWATTLENVRHARSMGLFPKMIISKRHREILKESVAKKVIDNSTGVVYETIIEASISLGIKKSTLTHYLLGTRKNKTSLSYFL